MKKIVKSLVIIITILFLLFPTPCFAADKKDEGLNFKKQVQDEDGSLFEKIIAECIARNCTNSYECCYF